MIPIDKADWRARIRAARDQSSEFHENAAANLAKVALNWLETLDAGNAAVCAYISTGAEPPTTLLLAALTESGRRVYVPVCEPGYQLSWVLWQKGVMMVRSSLAPVMEPVGHRLAFGQLGHVAAIFIPALAVDASGIRLGQGGGYYDRFLAGRSETVAALVYDDELLPAGALPHNSFDVPLDFALTPSGPHQLGGTPGPKAVPLRP